MLMPTIKSPNADIVDPQMMECQCADNDMHGHSQAAESGDKCSATGRTRCSDQCTETSCATLVSLSHSIDVATQQRT